MHASHSFANCNNICAYKELCSAASNKRVSILLLEKWINDRCAQRILKDTEQLIFRQIKNYKTILTWLLNYKNINIVVVAEVVTKAKVVKYSLSLFNIIYCTSLTFLIILE